MQNRKMGELVSVPSVAIGIRTATVQHRKEAIDLIEMTVLRFLEQRLPYPVYMEIPKKDIPTRFFVLRKADSGREDFIDSAIFTVMSYAESLMEAAKMNDLAKNGMDNLIELDEVSASRRNGDYAFPDPQIKRHRYQTVHNITHY